MKKSLLCIFISSWLFVIACNKDNNNTVPADEPAIINITSPAANTILLNGTLLTIQGDVSDNNGLASVNVAIRNKNTNSIFFQQASQAWNVNFYRYNFTWTISGITISTPSVIKITATDQYGVQVIKERDVIFDN